MITAVSKDNWVDTHIIEYPPAEERRMFAITLCGQMIHSTQMQTEVVESEDEVRQLCEECENK
jgi:hypothetical protein